MIIKSTKIKEKINYDERSAGGIVFKKEAKEIKWLMIKTISGKARFSHLNEKSKDHRDGHYKFPKGHLQKGEFLKQAALREVEEEGRIKAKILTKLGSNDYLIYDRMSRKKIIKKVTFFLMEYTGESSLKHFDKETVIDRGWFGFEEAGERLSYGSERILLGKAKRRLEALLNGRKAVK